MRSISPGALRRAEPGPMEVGLQRAGTSFADAGRFAAFLPAALLAPLAAPADRVPAVLAAGFTTATAAGVWLSLHRAHLAGRATSPTARAIQVLDIAGLLVIGLLQPELVGARTAQSGAGLVYIAIQMAVVAYAMRLTATHLVLLLPALCGSYLIGSLRMPVPGVASWTSWLVATGLLSLAVRLLLFRAAAGTDRALLAQQEADRARALAAGRRADERARLAVLHDTVAATLLMVGSGTVDRDDTWLRAQAERDLAVLTGPELRDQVPDTLDRLLGEVAAEGPLHAEGRIDLDLDPALRSGPAVPQRVLRALAGAVRESLTNVHRHAGPTAQVAVAAGPVGAGFQVLISDGGRGFDPAGNGGGPGRGLRESVLDRCREAGVGATVRSAPGSGTEVLLQWPGTAADEVPGRQDDVGAADQPLRLAQRLRLGVLLVPLVLFGVLEPVIVAGRRELYDAVSVQYAVLAVLTGVVLVTAALELTGRPGRRIRWGLLAVSGVAVLASVHGVAPAGLGTAAQWSLTDLGWVVCILLSRSRPAVLLAALGAGMVINFSPELLGTDISDQNAVVAATLVTGITAIQLAVTLSTRMVAGWAQVAQQAVQRDAAMVTREEVVVRVHADRARLYQDLATRVAPLLRGLADGSLDPGQATVQRDCALEATRLRRLLAENDSVATPLVHELRASVDVAERRGIAVHLMVQGVVPELDLPVRRALIDPVAAVLTVSASRARVTVFADDRHVSVSVLADVPVGVEPRVEPGASVELTSTRGDDGLWLDVQAPGAGRWVVRPSPPEAFGA